MGKFIPLNKAQKEEIRRLTQLANRRIVSATKAYEKEGRKVAPKEVVGPYQVREQWHTNKMPMSRSVKFETQAAFKRHMKFLQSFDDKLPGPDKRPTITEYTKLQRSKTADAIENSLGAGLPDSIYKKINKLSAPQLAQFWKVYSDKAAKLGVKYSSDVVMELTLQEFFPEDMALFDEQREQGG